MDRVRIQGLCVAVSVVLAGAAKGEIQDEAAGIAFFEANIRPVLVENCYKCHSVEADKVKGGLLLDSREGIRKGGDSGAAVEPGDAGASLLLTAMAHEDPDLEMPPKKDRLPEGVIADFRKWIAMGAPDPREGGGTAIAAGPPVSLEAGRAFWAFVKPVAHPLPAVEDPDWERSDLDRFVLAKLEENGLAPSPDAEPAVLLRRIYFDLIGLPPAPGDVEAFVRGAEAEGLDAVITETVDALLGSERFGERWGRHWLDVARFAESSGKETNVSFPHAWRYRDYVIDSVNADKPYDRFIVEQIAGDLLPAETDEERAELMIATGYLALGPKGLNEMNPAQFVADVADEQIDSVTRAVMASTVACARCHDHKFDPFTMRDYYALAGMFVSTKTYYGTRVAPGNNVGGDLLLLPEIEGQRKFNKPIPEKRLAALKSELAQLKAESEAGRAAMKMAMATGKKPANMKMMTLQEALRNLWRTGAIEGQLETVGDGGEALPLAMGVSDREEIVDAPLLARGEIASPGETVPRGFPEVVELDVRLENPEKKSGRAELAQWLTHPDHPLTARVMANRVWRHLFGAGIVSTMDNFGFNGARPSHPELLDHLALRFTAGSWSVKKLVREIVLSRAYRQASTFDEASFVHDPGNRLLWRASKRRLDAEAIRDAMLAVSGNLDADRPEGSLIAEVGHRDISIIAFAKNVPPDLDGSNHRSVYLPVLRDKLPDVLELFDFAEPSLVTGDRETTNVPLQALYLMNSPFVMAQAESLAARVAGESDEWKAQARAAFVLCLSREPDAEEKAFAAEFFEKNKEKNAREVLAGYCQALLATAEFRNLD